MSSLSIGQLSDQTTTPRPTIRYYESLGLLPKPKRGPGGQRRYGPPDVARLNFIRSRRALDFPLAEIARMIRVTGPEAAPCPAARSAAQMQLQQVRTRMVELQRIEATLLAQIDACETGCGPGPSDACLLLPI